MSRKTRNAYYTDSIESAVSESFDRDYNNGMATDPVTVEQECSYVKVTRKAGSLDSPPLMLFTVVPKNGLEPQLGQISEKIIDSMGLYGDLSVNFKNQGGRITAVVGI